MAHRFNQQDTYLIRPEPSAPVLVCDGDSLTAGQWPTSIASDLPDWDIEDLAVAGKTAEEMRDSYVTTSYTYYSSVRADNIAVLWGGTNDISGGATLEEIQSSIAAYVAHAKATGFSVIVLTIIPSAAHGGGESVRQSLNTWIRANSFGADAIVDPCALTPFEDGADVWDTDYYTDGSHLTALSTSLITDLILDGVVAVARASAIAGDLEVIEPLASFDITDPANIDSFTRASAAGFTGNGETAFQREAAADVLRSSHYVSGVQCVLLEDSPTACALVAPGTPSVTPGELKFSASWTAIAVTASLLRYEYRLDGTGGWTSNGTGTTLTDVAATAGSHTLNVRAVSTSGVAGSTATSASFEVTGSPMSFSDNFNRANEVPISTPWETDIPNYSGVLLDTNRVYSPGAIGIARVDPDSYAFASAHEATVEIVVAGGDLAGPMVNCDAAGNAYHVYYNSGAGTAHIIRRSSDTTFTQVGSDIGSVSFTTGDAMTLRSDGAGALTLLKNGSSVATRTDGSPLTGGQPGIWSIYGTAVDNFSASDI